ncbi:MAG: cytidylate kinase family protein [Oscillospiraceae bacterium]|jgi:cytidylate kinase
MSVITISRQAGSLGDEVAQALSLKLGWELISRETVLKKFLAGITNSYEYRTLSESAKFYLRESRDGKTFLQHMKDALLEYAKTKSVILLGFGSQAIFSGDEDAIHIRIMAPEDIRIQRIRKNYHIGEEQAREILSISDLKHRKFVSTLFRVDVSDPSLYNITLNTAKLSVFDCLNIILSMLEQRELSQSFEKQAEEANALSNSDALPVLKNPSETEFAKILDMYHIDWRYEPKTFPIEWDAEGKVTLAFSPDFYLTKFNTYIELTVMNQKYINKKMKKISRLRELYPDINIRIVNKKNFNSLLERFGPRSAEA